MTDATGRELLIGQTITWPGHRDGKKVVNVGRIVGLLERDRLWVWSESTGRKYRHATIKPSIATVVGYAN